MEHKESHQTSSVLLIDRSVRSIQLVNGKVIQKDVCTTVPKPPKYSLQNCCDHLLCFVNYKNDQDPVRLLDVKSDKVTTLPVSSFLKIRYPCHVISYYGTGLDRRSNVYKTLRIEVVPSYGLCNQVRAAELNRFGEDEWVLLKGKLPSGSIFGKPVVVDGALVWADFPQTNVAMSSQRYASVFDLHEERFFSVKLPPKFRSVGHLVGLNGKLCAVDLSSDSSIHIWVLPEFDGLWESMCTIKMRTVEGEEDHRMTRVIGSLGDNGKLLLKSYTAYFAYEIESEKLQFLHVPEGMDTETEAHCYAGELD